MFFALGVTIEPDIAHIQPHSQHLIIANQLFQPLSAIIGVPPGVRPRRSCFTTFAIVRKPELLNNALGDFELAKLELLTCEPVLEFQSRLLRPQFSSSDVLASLLLDADSQGLGLEERLCMAFTASTFHLSLAGLVRTVLTRIAAPPSPMTTTCFFFLGVNTNPRREHPTFLQ